MGERIGRLVLVARSAMQVRTGKALDRIGPDVGWTKAGRTV